MFFFFFQAEDGIRDIGVTGVQTCALPIYLHSPWYDYVEDFIGVTGQVEGLPQLPDGKFLPPMEMTCAEVVVKDAIAKSFPRSEERRVGKECRSWWATELKKKNRIRKWVM